MKTPLHLSGRPGAIAITLAIAIAGTACGGNGSRGSGAAAGENRPSGVTSPGVAGSGGGSAVTPTTAVPAARPGTAAGAALPTSVDRVLKLAHSAERASYTVTYRAILPGGARATVRVAQRAPRFRFEQTRGSQRSVAVFDGKVLHGCVPVAGGWRCTQTVSLDDPTVVSNAYPPAVLLFIDNLAPMVNRSMTAKVTSRTVLGGKVDCATFTPLMRNPPPPSMYCVRPDGVMAYSRTSDGQVLELTAYRAGVNAQDLVPPR